MDGQEQARAVPEELAFLRPYNSVLVQQQEIGELKLDLSSFTAPLDDLLGFTHQDFQRDNPPVTSQTCSGPLLPPPAPVVPPQNTLQYRGRVDKLPHDLDHAYAYSCMHSVGTKVTPEGAQKPRAGSNNPLQTTKCHQVVRILPPRKK